MADRIITQRELGNNITEALPQAEAGTTFTITVRVRPVAKLRPIADAKRRMDAPAAHLRAELAARQVDVGFGDDVARMRELEELVDEPWRGD